MCFLGQGVLSRQQLVTNTENNEIKRSKCMVYIHMILQRNLLSLNLIDGKKITHIFSLWDWGFIYLIICLIFGCSLQKNVQNTLCFCPLLFRGLDHLHGSQSSQIHLMGIYNKLNYKLTQVLANFKKEIKHSHIKHISN